MTEPALVVQDLEKTFRIPKQHVHTLKERALHPFRSTDYREYPILKGVSFEVGRGEFFGIVGRNGSGKSTLLKCMAGIYRPERGKISVAGRLAPFIELGVGFNPDLSALDNVVINGVMMGLTPKEARRRFDEIIEFAELEDYLDMKLKNYSSGMQVRLAFSVMVQASADVLLIDEVLAVGDAAFAQKCMDVFYRLRDEGRTIILVTHDMSAVEQFCHRAMFLRDGEIELIGDPVEVGRAYLAANFADDPPPVDEDEAETQDDSELPDPAAAAQPGPPDRALVDVQVTDDAGLPVRSLPSGEPVNVRVDLEAVTHIEHPVLVVQLRNAEHAVVTGALSLLYEHGPLTPGQRVRVDVGWDVRLTDGRYDVGILMTQGTAESDVVIDARNAAELIVHSSTRETIGAVSVPTRVRTSNLQRERVR